jgi:hypothetical protein
MQCFRHPEAVSAAQCVGCEQPICADCREDVADHPMCHACVAAAEARLAHQESNGGTPDCPWTAAQDDGGAVPGADSTDERRTAAGRQGPNDSFLAEVTPPSVLRRIGRGWMWGGLYGQWWTLWSVISGFIWGQASLNGEWVVATLLMAIIYGFFGSLTGLIIGAANASPNAGTNIGVGVGLFLCLLELALSRDPKALINVIFYFFTGRYVGAGITGRVQHPVAALRTVPAAASPSLASPPPSPGISPQGP